MGRPPDYQWRPLGVDSDPVPGDPQAISAEAAHLASIAQTITGHVAAMRKIASDNAEQGQHAEKIRAVAQRTAASLQAVATRYARVSSALSGWGPELEQAQTMFDPGSQRGRGAICHPHPVHGTARGTEPDRGAETGNC